MEKKLNEEFLKKINEIYSKKELKIIEDWFKNKKPTTFRINSLKNDYDVLKNFEWYNYELEKIPYLKNSYKIIKNWTLKLSLMKSFKKWYIYVQWITSQIPVELIDFPEDIKNFKVLDLTAAPWGKSTQISWKMNNLWEIVSNEKNTLRLDKLNYTIKNLWAKNIEVIKWDANNLKEKFLDWYFDLIIADLPCSSEWRINLELEKTYKYLSKPAINKRNYKVAQEILKNNISLLKSWWQLLYSTCTLDPLENEGIVHFLLSNYPELEIVNISNFFEQKWIKELSKPWIKKYGKYIFRNEVTNSIRILPSKDTEWFFVAKFIKKL